MSSQRKVCLWTALTQEIHIIIYGFAALSFSGKHISVNDYMFPLFTLLTRLVPHCYWVKDGHILFFPFIHSLIIYCYARTHTQTVTQNVLYYSVLLHVFYNPELIFNKCHPVTLILIVIYLEYWQNHNISQQQMLHNALNIYLQINVKIPLKIPAFIIILCDLILTCTTPMLAPEGVWSLQA